MRIALLAVAFSTMLLPPVHSSDDKPRSALDALQGTWIVTRFERDTKVSSPEAIKDRILTIKGSEWSDKSGDKIHGKGTLKIVDGGSGKVHHIDALFVEGFLDGKTGLAIFEVDGDNLKACSSKPGDKRPAGFNTALNSGRMLVEYKRKAD